MLSIHNSNKESTQVHNLPEMKGLFAMVKLLITVMAGVANGECFGCDLKWVRQMLDGHSVHPKEEPHVNEDSWDMSQERSDQPIIVADRPGHVVALRVALVSSSLEAAIRGELVPGTSAVSESDIDRVKAALQKAAAPAAY